MPSKILISVANDLHRLHHLKERGIQGVKSLKLDDALALRFLRGLRDHFVKGVLVTSGKSKERFDAVLASLGRRPNTKGLGLEELGVKFDEKDLPKINPTTTQLPGLPIFMAGDVDAARKILHEAAHEGRIAGFNSVRKTPKRFKRRTPIAITFCEPRGSEPVTLDFRLVFLSPTEFHVFERNSRILFQQEFAD